jgi:DNA-directed RNA polymerase specialized sigma subunit
MPPDRTSLLEFTTELAEQLETDQQRSAEELGAAAMNLAASEAMSSVTGQETSDFEQTPQTSQPECLQAADEERLAPKTANQKLIEEIVSTTEANALYRHFKFWGTGPATNESVVNLFAYYQTAQLLRLQYDQETRESRRLDYIRSDVIAHLASYFDAHIRAMLQRNPDCVNIPGLREEFYAAAIERLAHCATTVDLASNPKQIHTYVLRHFDGAMTDYVRSRGSYREHAEMGRSRSALKRRKEVLGLLFRPLLPGEQRLSQQEIMTRFSLSKAAFHDIVQLYALNNEMTSLETPVHESQRALVDILPGQEGGVDDLQELLKLAEQHRVSPSANRAERREGLTGIELFVLRALTIGDREIKDIAPELGVSGSRVSQIWIAACKKLKNIHDKIEESINAA